MKDIVDLRVTQIRLYPIDVLPLSTLAIAKNLDPFRERLRFKTASATGEKPELAFHFVNGEIEHGGEVYLVERLAIEPQRLTFSLVGPSIVGEAFYEEVRKALEAADPTGVFGKSEPYIKSEETSCVATLDVHFRKLFSPSLLQFLEKTVHPKVSRSVAKTEVIPFNFAARISYELLDPELTKIGIRLSERKLIIEPRIRTHLDERRYFTQSPTDSKTHLALLRSFEKVFGASGKK